ncbi:ribosome biogenesis protein Noc4 [Coprinopsis cinerea okayama7|uniref:Ribosome biogenesis protein Noc4 n=1 Tax=Coprinopsis cinerea (strain Okayama-7 / 130 / ATCC MYA-4618 / FGSC 9003) TaxID=240176 RepID=A8ND12_COPC7|nr:ribosome biogenesis protein Noc4 [Coprinopsis cinerea okayama7\|eukprot:XP_001832676.1 ribosome biogenesis protein Noc4 [Coprinopsis cinerea okayama7\
MPAPVRSLPPTKKRKLDPSSSSTSTVSQIKSLEESLAEAIKSQTSLNALADLIQLVLSSSDAQDVSKGIYALYRTFVIIVSTGKLGLVGGDEAAKKVKAWLWERLNEYTDYLVGLLKDEEKHLRTSSIQILFSLQKHLSSSLSTTSSGDSKPQPQFHVSHFKKITNGLLTCPPSSRSTSNASSNDGDATLIDPDVLHLFYETWLSVYDDVRWFFLREAATILNTTSTKKLSSSLNATKNLLLILEKLNTFPTEQSELNAWWVPELGTKPPKPKKLRDGEDEDDASLSKPPGEEEEEEDDWRKFFEDDPTPKDPKDKQPSARLHQLTIHQSLHSLASHRAVFTRTWLTLLPRVAASSSGKGGSDETRRALSVRVLNIMHRGVLPHLTRPILVMDWIAGCVDMGGSLGLLGLNALFTLMKDYNLDYPSFYTRLYAFLDRDLLTSKYRARFFRMADLFLASTHLPATLLASFIKRLARLSLNAPPAAIVMIIPFTYNILKRHPALMVMIHRDADDEEDPYSPTEPNPLSTNALSSSLWELYTHRSHYHATVSTLTKIFSEAFTKPNYSMEDFLDHTYGTLFDTEVNRKIKKEPPLSMDCDKKFELFPSVELKLKSLKDHEAEGGGEEGEEQVQSSTVQGDLVSELWGF